MNESDELRLTRVLAVRDVAIDIRVFELGAADGRPLPAITAGAHIDVTTPNGMVRQYSLCDPFCSNGLYSIAVKRDANGRGGSAAMHERLQPGDTIAIAGPRNHFPLAPGQHHHLFIAGGIGITPILAMIRSVAAAGGRWELHYCARSAAHAAFLAELQELGESCVHPYLSEAPLFNAAHLLATPAADTHVYCCGPAPLMESVRDASHAWPEGTVHFEWFSAPAIGHGDDRPFEVELAKSGRVLQVAADQSILKALRAEGFIVASACEEGVCGTCETPMICGEADHRDMLLSEAERAANTSIMVCVSRAKSERIVLDL